MSILRLFHTGFQVIEKPDIKIGRANADFGQGFYLSNDEEFSRRWARDLKGETTYLNVYDLDTDGLQLKHFTRGDEWFEYIFNNRRNAADALADFDVIIGPIANDTIYDVLGITTSGILPKSKSLAVLNIGHAYEQAVIKSEKALSQLAFIRADVITPEEIERYRETVQAEEEQFQEEFVQILSEEDE